MLLSVTFPGDVFGTFFFFWSNSLVNLHSSITDHNYHAFVSQDPMALRFASVIIYSLCVGNSVLP